LAGLVWKGLDWSGSGPEFNAEVAEGNRETQSLP